MKIYEYYNYKKTHRIRKYTHDVVVNMTAYNDFTLIGEGEREFNYAKNKYAESNKDFARKLAEARRINNGIIVYYIAKTGWGLPYIFVFYKPN